MSMSHGVKEKKPVEIVSLRLPMGTKRELENGSVHIEGSCVILEDRHGELVIAYCMKPGDVLTQKDGEYVVEF